MGKQVNRHTPAKIIGFIDLTKPHLKKVIRKDGDREVKGKVSVGPKGFNTLALAFEKAKNSNGDEGLRDTGLHRGRTRQ